MTVKGNQSKNTHRKRLEEYFRQDPPYGNSPTHPMQKKTKLAAIGPIKVRKKDVRKVGVRLFKSQCRRGRVTREVSRSLLLVAFLFSDWLLSMWTPRDSKVISE
ncbi:hypothetical protein Bbelb_143060 [Branchiostoma belcheri]|nr:hypothetical protein Bbelb_143060 [Branchiostoma belcheri]